MSRPGRSRGAGVSLALSIQAETRASPDLCGVPFSGRTPFTRVQRWIYLLRASCLPLCQVPRACAAAVGLRRSREWQAGCWFAFPERLLQ